MNGPARPAGLNGPAGGHTPDPAGGHTPAGDVTPVELRTSSPRETQAVAAALAAVVHVGDVVLLIGDLGAGKTTFAQGFAAGLGAEGPVTSPTFTLVRHYRCRAPAATPAPVRTLLHADVYRLDHLHEVVDLGLGELVEDQAVALVEWGDVAAPVLGRGALHVRLQQVVDGGDEERVVQVAGPGLAGRRPAVVAAVAQWGVR